MTANGSETLMDAQHLAELERQTYRTEVDDGLWDLLLGFFFLVLGLGIITSLPGWLPVLVGAFGLPARQLVRSWLVEPRIGYVRLRRGRMASLQRGAWVLTGTMALLLVLFFWLDSLDSTGAWRDERRLGGIGMTLFLAMPIGVAAYWFEMRRFYAYAGLVGLILALGLLLGRPAWAILACGLAILPAGAVVLGRFLRRYPRRHRPLDSDA